MVDPKEGNSSDLDEAVETLSLCDLPIYGGDGDYWDDSSKDDQSSSSDQDFFEFFSEDFTASTRPAENIVFCGKLIPYRQLPVCKDTKSGGEKQEQQKKPKKRSLFKWRLKSFNKGKTSRSNSVDECDSKGLKLRQVSASKSFSYAGEGKYGCSPKKCVDQYDFRVPRVSILTSPAKSSWQMFMFGMVRIPPPEMELRDIKNRQSRRCPSTMFPLPEEGKKGGGDKRKGKSLWGLLGALGCSSVRANTVAKASLGCTPQV